MLVVDIRDESWVDSAYSRLKKADHLCTSRTMPFMLNALSLGCMD
jgi:hypothetical protein